MGDFHQTYSCLKEAFKVEKTFKEAQELIDSVSKLPHEFLIKEERPIRITIPQQVSNQDWLLWF
jgi:hypothetical protein